MNKQSPQFVIADPSTIEQVDDGIKRQFLGYGPDLMAVKVWFDEGAEGYQHHHHHTQVSYVESGEFEATIDGETKILRAGDSFYVAPNKSHGAVCKKAGVLIDIFSPLREDFLGGE
jgi:quercetin dioxygenase-like cupin family protein